VFTRQRPHAPRGRTYRARGVSTEVSV
jgi:hypothetical protein